MTQYHSVTDGQIDSQTDEYVVAYTTLAKLALWRAVKLDGLLNVREL